MSKPPSNTGRLIDDDAAPFGQTPRPRPTVVPPNMFAGVSQSETPQLAAPASAPPPAVPLQPAQRACYEALGLALQEGHVFAAVTGPEGSGKTTVLEAVLADRHDRALRCIRISDPDKVPARLAAQIEQVAYAEASKPENLERHVVLAIDDAHIASSELLRCLARLAAMREPGRRVPQVLLVGRQELWGRLSAEEYAPLARRLAIRAVLPALQAEQDPWASLEHEVSQTMSQLRAESEHIPAAAAPPHLSPLFDRAYSDLYPTTVEEAGMPFDPATVPLPTDFALFPDPPPRAEGKRGESRRRLLLPLGCLMAGVAAFTFALSFFDWPGFFDDMPWADNKPTPSFTFPQTNQVGLPQTPAWVQHTPQAALPHGAPPAPPPAAVAAVVPIDPPGPPSAPQAALSPLAVEPGPTVSEPAPAMAESARTAPVSEAARPADPPAPVDLSIKPPDPPKPVVASATEMSHPTSPVPLPSLPSQASVQTAPALPEAANKPVVTPPASPVDTPTTVASLAASAMSTTASRSLAGRAGAIAVVKPAPLPPAIVGLLLRRGDEQLAIGDVSAARLLFERAAESGNAQGAFRLARTYDSSFLPPADAATLANRSEARAWYGRAASLGDRDAAARLRDLNEGH